MSAPTPTWQSGTPGYQLYASGDDMLGRIEDTGAGWDCYTWNGDTKESLGRVQTVDEAHAIVEERVRELAVFNTPQN